MGAIGVMGHFKKSNNLPGLAMAFCWLLGIIIGFGIIMLISWIGIVSINEVFELGYQITFTKIVCIAALLWIVAFVFRGMGSSK